ncbi:MAG: hypothetical protein BWK76_22750 [Desulfobulbaceae bacterium A2]|nr:MAG: hypothetical protein BWK76_22750 [Desulfobulbaceae bacterium A2]
MTTRRRVGIVGVPPLAVIRRLNEEGCQILDLDESQVRADIDLASAWLPRVYCAILRTAVLNAMHLQLDELVIDVGPGKCDCALHVAAILADRLAIPVTPTRNEDRQSFGTPLCRTAMPLMERMAAITRTVRDWRPHPPQPPCEPTAGFWGVPPRDFSLLAAFPEQTHVYGWSRCLENKTPADLDLEGHVNLSVPTIFFAQSFCAKTALARHLAAKHPRGLYLDCDVSASGSVRAKIEAFFQLHGAVVPAVGGI